MDNSENIRQVFDLAATPPTDEQALLDALAARIATLLDEEPEQLFSMLYRLDVLEEKIRPVLAPGAPEPINFALARLVLERQKQRVETKRNVKSAPLEGLDGWEW